MLPDHQLATPWLEYVDTFVLVFTIIQEDSCSSTILIPIVLSFFPVYFFVPKSKLSTFLYVAGMLQFHLTLSLNGLEAPDVDWCYWSPGCLLGRQWRSSSVDFELIGTRIIFEAAIFIIPTTALSTPPFSPLLVLPHQK